MNAINEEYESVKKEKKLNVVNFPRIDFFYEILYLVQFFSPTKDLPF